jgi:hypothetical protein
MVAEQPQRDPVGQLAVTVDEFAVGVDVAFLGTPDEVVVTDVYAHSHSRAPRTSRSCWPLLPGDREMMCDVPGRSVSNRSGAGQETGRLEAAATFAARHASAESAS